MGESARDILRGSWRRDPGGCLVGLAAVLAMLGVAVYFLVTLLRLEQRSRASVEREAAADAGRPDARSVRSSVPTCPT